MAPIDVTEMPALQPADEAGVFNDESRATNAGFGLERSPDGIEAYIESRAATRPRR